MIEKLEYDKDLWDLFSKDEEYRPPILDKFGRFPYYLSKNRDIFEPIVSKFLVENGLNISYQDNKKFAVCLTHDIDIVYPSKLGSFYNITKSLLAGHQIKETLEIPFYRISKKWNPLWNFRRIMNMEEKYNATSSFYFLALHKGDLDFNFKIEDLKNELSNIADRGWEVGLHGGHEAYNNLEKIKENKRMLENVLGKRVVGYRNHYLRFKIPDTWSLLSEAGFKYDTTFGYADCVGFRNGMCHPFKPFNLNTNEEIEILEIPLTIMDRTLFNYMNFDFKGAWHKVKDLIDVVKKYNGVITILWHNTDMIGNEHRLYEKILQYCYEQGAWMTSGEEIWKWWSKGEGQ